MSRTRLLWCVVALSLGPGCRSAAPVQPAPSVSPVTDGVERSAHFELRWTPGTVTPEERSAVVERAEASWRAYRERLGEARLPSSRLEIRLEAAAGQGQYPYVDPGTGTLVLYRYAGKGGGYEGSLAHELVHALRWKLWAKDPAYQTDAALFFEEGFAELLATDAGFPSDFPRFGREVVIAAGAWLDPTHALTIPELVEHHRALNFRCMPQAYAERLSFFEFLRTQAGLAPLVTLAYGGPVTGERLARAYAKNLPSLAHAWRTWQDEAFSKIPDAAAKAADYRAHSPIQYLHACTREELEAPPAP